MAAKMKTFDEQSGDYQRHISVLKESLCAKEEHYNMLHSDVRKGPCFAPCFSLGLVIYWDSFI
jgi:hypothetical protein